MRSHVRLMIAIVTVALVGAWTGGCGEEDRAPPLTSGPSLPSKAAFTKQANRECAKQNVGLGGEVATFVERQRQRKPRPVLTADVAHFVLLPAIEQQLGLLYELIQRRGVPAGDHARIYDMLSSERHAIDKVATSYRIQSLRAVYRPFRESARMLRAYGLDACANWPGIPSGVTVPSS